MPAGLSIPRIIINGFGYPDGKFRFKPDWANVPTGRKFDWGLSDKMPSLPDYWDVNEKADAAHPFKLATSPARNYLNSTFNETPTSRAREGRPTARINPADLETLGIADGEKIRMGNARGEIVLHAQAFDGVLSGVVIVESIPPNSAFENGEGINTLTSAEQAAPFGGAAFHDSHCWIRKASSGRLGAQFSCRRTRAILNLAAALCSLPS